MYLFTFLFLAVVTTQCNVIKNENIEDKISRIKTHTTKLEVINILFKKETEKPYYYEAMKNLIQQKIDVLETRYFKYVNETLEQARQTGKVDNILVDSVYYSMFAEFFDDPEFTRISNKRVDELITDENIRKSLHEINGRLYSTVVKHLKEFSKLFATKPIDFAEECLTPEDLKSQKEKGDVLTESFNKFMMDIINEIVVILRTNGKSEEEANKIVSNITFSSF